MRKKKKKKKKEEEEEEEEEKEEEEEEEEEDEVTYVVFQLCSACTIIWPCMNPSLLFYSFQRWLTPCTQMMNDEWWILIWYREQMNKVK